MPPRKKKSTNAPEPMSNNEKSIAEHLKTIGIDPSTAFIECLNLDDEFKVIKKAYFKKILVVHPDKGGTNEECQLVVTSFDILRMEFEKKNIPTFASSQTDQQTFSSTTSTEYDDIFKGFVPRSWEFYSEAAEERDPPYRVELAKSNRSSCVKCTDKMKRAEKKGESTPICSAIIEKDAIRFGSMDPEAGTYTRWSHIDCWRVPMKIWKGVPDPDKCKDVNQFIRAISSMNEVLICGFNELSLENKLMVVAKVMNKENWARETKPKNVDPAKSTAAPSSSSYGKPSSYSSSAPSSSHVTSLVSVPASISSNAMTVAPTRFVVPVPGRDGAIPNILQGKTIVLTGTFPELGGGEGLNLGKDRCKQMCEAFGGKVTSAVSGKTNLLIVGKEPGMSKVSKARSQHGCQLLSIHDLKLCIEDKQSFTAIQPLVIKNFSAGYGGNGLALIANSEQYSRAAGLTPVIPALPKAPKAASPPKAKPAAANKKRKTEAKSAPVYEPPTDANEAKDDSMLPVALTTTGLSSITCDDCGVDCTLNSVFVGETEQDFCPKCFKDSEFTIGEMQSYGLPKAKSTKKRKA